MMEDQNSFNNIHRESHTPIYIWIILVVLLSGLAGTGTLYFLETNKSQERINSLQSQIAPLRNDVSKLQQEKNELNNQLKVEKAKPVFEAGKTVLISKNVKPWNCSKYGDTCEKILVTTEVYLTEPSMGDTLTGKFYIRSYDGNDYLNSPKIGELQITQNFNPFAGDGGGVPYEKDTKEILTIKMSPDSLPTDEFRFQNKFYLEYLNLIPSFNTPGYILHINNDGETSQFDQRMIDFLYKNENLSISTPQ